MSSSPTTVAILCPGEMGAAVARILRPNGARVISTAAGRSTATIDRCREAGIELLPTLDDVIAQSKVVISLVPPAAAEQVVDEFCSRIHLAPADALFIDLNSISPETAQALAARVEQAGRDYVDGAINGLARNLTSSGTVLLSGRRAAEVAPLFAGAARVRILSDHVGAASAMKMLLAGLSKGLCGLFAELALIAQQHDMLDSFSQMSTEIYPGMMLVVDRMLPTYAQHAARRATEMQELEATAQSAGIEPPVIAAIRQLHDLLASASFDHKTPSVASLIQQLMHQGFLQTELNVSGEKHPSL